MIHSNYLNYLFKYTTTTVISSTIFPSQAIHLSQAICASASAASLALECLLASLAASSLEINSHTPSLQASKNSSSSSISNALTSGRHKTPIVCAMASPKALLIAIPGCFFPFTNTLCGISPSSFFTSPPILCILSISSGSVGLWSLVRSFEVNPWGDRLAIIARESPTCPA